MLSQARLVLTFFQNPYDAQSSGDSGWGNQVFINNIFGAEGSMDYFTDFIRRSYSD